LVGSSSRNYIIIALAYEGTSKTSLIKHPDSDYRLSGLKSESIDVVSRRENREAPKVKCGATGCTGCLGEEAPSDATCSQSTDGRNSNRLSIIL
jgi:hypothetical protein